MSNARGSTALIFSLALPAVLAVIGASADFAVYGMKLTRLHAAADQAAISGAKELTVVHADASTVSQAADRYARSIFGNSGGSLDVKVEVSSKKDSVKVTLTERWTPFFAQFIGLNVTPVVVTATAKLAGAANICVLTLNPSATKAMHMDKLARLMAPDCAVHSNSSHVQAIRLDKNSQLSAALICAVGGVQAKTDAITPAPTTDCPVLPDPLAARVAPPIGTCKSTNLTLSSGTHTLNPGTYCGGIKISGTAKVSFTKGNYIIKDGVFDVSGTASVSSENAGFYLKGESSILNFTGNTTLSMTGATTGEMAGLLFFEDRNVSIGRIHRINSAYANKLTGTIYLSKGKLRIDPNSSVAQDSAYTAIIANQVEVDEGPTLVLNSDYGASNVPVPEGIQMSSQVVLTE
jgi:Flp pilus assembly protein TadG